MAGKVTFSGELMFPSEYVSSVELKGRDVTVTISDIKREALRKTDGTSKPEWVMRFHESPKRFVCNKTNANSIAEMYGSKAEQWVGKRITLYPTTCMAFGKKVDCIRIREVVPPPKRNGQAQQAPAPEPVPDYDAPPMADAPTQEEAPSPTFHPLVSTMVDHCGCAPEAADLALREYCRASVWACDLEDLDEKQTKETKKLILSGKIKP